MKLILTTKHYILNYKIEYMMIFCFLNSLSETARLLNFLMILKL